MTHNVTQVEPKTQKKQHSRFRRVIFIDGTIFRVHCIVWYGKNFFLHMICTAMPRILSRTLQDQRHGRRRRREQRTNETSALDVQNDSGECDLFGFSCWSNNSEDYKWKSSSSAGTPSPSTSPLTLETLSPSDSSAELSNFAFARKTARSDSLSMQPSAKRRSIFSSVPANQYMSSSNVEADGETWGHFVDVDEEEQKIVRHSRILSRGSSFASSFGSSSGYI